MEEFGSSGVRGVALETLTPEYALDLAGAAGSVFAENHDRAALGRDTRETGGMFADAVASGLASVGCRVDRLGVVPTPSLQAYCEREGVPGVMVTASHNPPEFNGIKLCGSSGVELTRDVLEEIERRFHDGYDTVDWQKSGHSNHVDGANRAYREELLAAVDRDRIADANLTVALDPAHGAGALTNPQLFRELGCRVLTVNGQPDGRFPGRDPEPVKEHLGDLEALVAASEADVGIAHDGDADRAMIVDETGTLVEGDAVLAALAATQLEAGDTVVSAVNCSQRLVDVVDEVGAGLHLTPIGSTYLITAITKLQGRGERVPIAGEGNGGIMFPDYRVARDGAYTAAKFCELLADQPASVVLEPYGGYHQTRTNLEYETDAERTAMVDAIEQYAAAADIEADTIDGYRLDYGDAWVLARPSGTEPMIRVYAEAREQERAESLLDGMVEAIEQA
ncbi:phosphoglucosamine mutase [Halovenus sp. HT40]|uniref:phosphoglucosamine mutase n=1 Tax=Halovenus sp. HT40 TaxID=3126691 RepID=UPI00300F395F